jgi:methyltransferase
LISSIVIESKDETVFDSAIDLVKPQTIHYSMTNPPFFSDNFNDSDNNCEEMKSDFDVNNSSNELKTKSKSYSRKKSLANTSIVTEAICDGGEVEFVHKMIDQSLQIRDKIMIYSSMLGKKRSLLELKNIIEQYIEKGLITSFVSTEFCQGLTKRWGIAWTFINGLNLKEVATIKSVKSKPPLIYFLPPIMKEAKYDMQSISQKIKSLLINDLKIDSFEIKENRKSIEFIIKANENTWSHQRKRRREAKLKLKPHSEYDSDIKSSDSQINETLEHKMIDYSCDSGITNESNSDKIQTLKRSLEDINEDIKSIDLETKKSKTCKEYGFNELYLLHCSLLIKRDKQSIYIQLETKELAQNQESTYQLFQYFKNNLI